MGLLYVLIWPTLLNTQVVYGVNYIVSVPQVVVVVVVVVVVPPLTKMSMLHFWPYCLFCYVIRN